MVKELKEILQRRVILDEHGAPADVAQLTDAEKKQADENGWFPRRLASRLAGVTVGDPAGAWLSSSGFIRFKL